MDNNITGTLAGVKRASRTLNTISDARRSDILRRLADAVDCNRDMLLAANRSDLARMDPANPLYDRLQLTPGRLAAIADDIRHVASLQCPIGEIIDGHTLPNGLRIRRVRVPFGVIGVIYEARPNVTFDVFSLCFKSGNACVLKGGSDAADSNAAIVGLIHKVLEEEGVSPDVIALLPSTHEVTAAMLGAVGYIDVCIPRGGRRLIDFVRDNARVPVIETGAGVVSAYFDRSGNLEMGQEIVTNAKTRRVSVCNALDTLLIHRERLADLPALCAGAVEKGVRIYADSEAFPVLAAVWPEMTSPADENTYSTEWMDYKMGVRTVGSLDEAMEHIARYGSGHSECIITDDAYAAERFQREVDAACVYVNAPTSFTDGGQFGLGAEIGISTQKLGPRGPMGLREITTYRYLINGEGQTRP